MISLFVTVGIIFLPLTPFFFSSQHPAGAMAISGVAFHPASFVPYERGCSATLRVSRWGATSHSEATIPLSVSASAYRHPSSHQHPTSTGELQGAMRQGCGLRVPASQVKGAL